MAASRYTDQYRAGLDVRNVLGVAEGYVALAGAVLQCAAAQDADWFDREPTAARYWCDVAQVDPGGFRRALQRWQSRQPAA